MPFSPPCVGEEEVAAAAEAIRSGWLTTGPKTAQFEADFRDFVGAPAAIAVNSCTAALGLALRLHNVGPGDEVISTTMTFVSTLNVVQHVGARPVLVDVEPDTLNIDPRAVARAITPRTKAIIAVHYAGHPADLDRLAEAANEAGVPLIEDAAHAVPAAHRGQMIGASDRLTAFSFYATKNLAVGEGGMLTGSAELLERARRLSLHGMSRDAWNRYGEKGNWFYEVLEAGQKCNLSDVQSSIGLVQLAKLPAMQARRQAIWDAYNEAFDRLPGLQTPATRTGVDHAHHLYVLRIRPGAMVDRDQLIAGLAARGVRTSLHFIPVHLHRHYRQAYGYGWGDFPVAEDAYGRMLSLPLSPALSDAQVEAVIQSVGELVGRRARRAA
ncbi:DegT/DnrJ/EryC1/StrS family aminotransferase [Pirellulimonas nuda]|uniref:DegT/DnrJ/EryC1/StrS family aminotransferase n=1 Tax=Pirellulimonas nuda TaxID=2528009 RepID=UPI0018D3C7F2|nr:DegT/DnrJ/EryC1/StrS family aminotransferase [Pirellulimonas nuda]